jgi:hypothetical protein
MDTLDSSAVVVANQKQPDVFTNAKKWSMDEERNIIYIFVTDIIQPENFNLKLFAVF